MPPCNRTIVQWYNPTHFQTWVLGCSDTWVLRCSNAWILGYLDAQRHMLTVLSTVHCPIISCFLTVVRCVTILGEFDILSKKICRIFTLCLCNVIFSIAQKFLCVGLAMCISIYIYDCCVFAANQGVFAVHATFGPLHRGGSRQWNQEVLCLTQPSSSSSTHCRGIWQCKESSSHSAAALLQCRETRHAQNVPPLSHSGAAAAGLFCQSLT